MLRGCSSLDLSASPKITAMIWPSGSPSTQSHNHHSSERAARSLCPVKQAIRVQKLHSDLAPPNLRLGFHETARHNFKRQII